jgi:chemotaxis methyl-accepting protein methylase
MPNVDTTGVEISDFLCHQHGWSKGSVVDFGIDSAQQYDLVICNDVLAYLSNAQCAKAIKNRQIDPPMPRFKRLNRGGSADL